MDRLLVAGAAALSVAMSIAIAAGAPAQARSTSLSPKAFIKAVNADADTTISKDELDTYARKRFAALETDNDKTLNDKELKGRLSASGMSLADSDKDRSVDESEFVGFADKLFAEANGKGDTTLRLRELRSPAGKNLIKLLH